MKKPVSPLRYIFGIPLVAIGVALFFAGFVSALKGKSSKSSSTTTMTESATPTATETAHAVEAKPATLTDQIASIISDLSRDISDIEVYQGQDGLFKASFFYSGTPWDDTSLIRGLLTDYVKICKKTYQIDGVENLECYVFADMIDARGNSDREKIFAISMDKETFEKYNWGNIAFLPGSAETIMKDCKIFDIHAGINKNIDYAKIYYTGS